MKTKQILFGLGALTLSGIAYWYFTKGKVDEIKSNVTAKNKKNKKKMLPTGHIPNND